MSPQDIESIRPTLERIISDTQSARMKWQRGAPTVFNWVKTTDDTPEARITLQKVQTPRPTIVRSQPGAPARQVMEIVENFILQINDLHGRGLVMTINTQQDPDLRPLFKQLFDTVSAGADKGAIDYFKKIFETN